MNNKQKILIILGPTASGKSDLAVKLAKKYNGEVISADSRQVYRGLNIGTGKITRKEMKGVRHHLLDVADPRRQFTVQRFKILADKAIIDITKRGKLPIICGGTGFYIDTLVNNIELPAVKADLKLRARLARKSTVKLLAMLKKLDRKRWQTINSNPSDKKNARRLIRAIEIAHGSKRAKTMAGERIRSVLPTNGWVNTTNGKQTSTRSPCHNYEPIFIGLQVPPAELKIRIRQRLLKRIRQGMVLEAIRLHAPRTPKNPYGGLSWKRMEDLGLEYRYLSRYLRGLISKQEMIDQLNTAIWQYARRQRTWFKRNENIKWAKTNPDIKMFSRIIR